MGRFMAATHTLIAVGVDPDPIRDLISALRQRTAQ